MATTQILIEIPSDNEREQREKPKTERNSGSKRKNNGRNSGRRWTRRRYSDVEVWTKDEKVVYDDECCILTSDPLADADLSRPVCQNEGLKQDDEVAVVAARGKIPCRDYPHPRHTCAEFPFAQTSHEKHCSNCFCYVCDIAAPCKYWRGKEGHCDASSSDKYWNSKRQSWRFSRNVAKTLNANKP
ncbi:hypothetical protein LUZ60_014302 [Juncus effusus]|nr:hypothetical protein LUZ60_014302 [Juncus effusus]